MSRTPISLSLLALLVACGKKDSDDTGGPTDTTDTDTDTTQTDTDTDTTPTTETDTDVTDSGTTTPPTTTPAACDPIQDGKWMASGTAFGMEMSAQLQSDIATCSFKLTNWDMQMDVPSGGTIAGDQVTLAGGKSWSTCVGTLTGGTEIQGTCGDGSTFMMQTN